MFGLSSCGSPSREDAAAEKREKADEALAFRLEQEADFWWRLHGLTGDWFYVGGQHGAVGGSEGIRTRADLLEWLKGQEIKRDLAVVTVTPRVSGAPGDPFQGRPRRQPAVSGGD